MKEQAPFSIMLVDDEKDLLESFQVMFECAGYPDVRVVHDSREVMGLLAQRPASVIVLDLYMPYLSGMELLVLLREHYPQIPVIVMTAANQVETAVSCIKSGVADYLVKPVEAERLLSGVGRLRETHDLRTELSSLKERLLADDLEHADAFVGIVTRSSRMKRIFQYLEAVAGTGQPVLITGETGVGKELVARSLHEISGLCGRFVPINVAGLDDQMFSDTLFGHIRGAFSGAYQRREGLLVQAEQGTLFLDEIGDLSPGSQVKLLRLIQDQEYYPLGSDLLKRSNARIVVATNRNLLELMERGEFRPDLYYRLSAHQVQIPPLRQRLEDIPLLLHHFLRQAAAQLDKPTPTPPAELCDHLANYHFPGNVRQLQIMVFDAVTRHRKGVLSISSFREAVGSISARAPIPSPCAAALPLDEQGRSLTLKQAEEYLVQKALAQANGNQSIAASLLGITRQALNKKLIRRKNREG